MINKGVRGAITVEENTKSSIHKAVIELMTELKDKNNISEDNISHIIFTLTEDLDAEFPAKFVRCDFKWNKAAMLCMHEINVPGSLKKCLRVLIVLNCDDDFEPEFVYLKGAAVLRG